MASKSRRRAAPKKAQAAQVTLKNFEPNMYKVAAMAAVLFLDGGETLIAGGFNDDESNLLINVAEADNERRVRVKRTASNNIIVYDAGPPPVCPPDLAWIFLKVHRKLHPEQYTEKSIDEVMAEAYPGVKYRETANE